MIDPPLQGFREFFLPLLGRKVGGGGEGQEWNAVHKEEPVEDQVVAHIQVDQLRMDQEPAPPVLQRSTPRCAAPEPAAARRATPVR